MLSLALKCKPSKEVLRHLDNGIDKLASEVCELLSKVSVDENEETRCYAEFTADVDKARVSFRAPKRKKGPMEKRSKDALEAPKKGKDKATSKKGRSKAASKKGRFTVYFPRFE